MLYNFPDPPKRQNFGPGEILLNLGMAEEALPFLRRTWDNDPKSPSALTNMGIACRIIKEFDDAMMFYSRALDADGFFAPAWYNAGILEEDIGKFENALDSFKRAHKLKPDHRTAFRLATALMREMRFQDAMQLWEDSRAGQSYTPVPELPIWTGDMTKGKRILAVREGGHGDVFMLIRYLQDLTRWHGAQIDYAGFSSQRALLMRQQGMARLGVELLDTDNYDYYLPLMSTLTHYLTEDTPNFESSPFYMRSFEPMPESLKNIHGRVVGVCSAASGEGVRLNLRSTSLDNVMPLQEINATFVSLQLGPCPDWMVNLDLSGDWLETARAISRCDVVVSVDTAVAHLAGAMGIQTYVLVPCGSDWKWFRGLETSPWYPSVRVVRSEFPYGLKDAFQEVVSLIA